MASPLVAVQELATIPSTAAPLLVDVRWRLGGPPGRDTYRAGHLPGAVFADLDHDLAGPPGRSGRHPLPETGAVGRALRRLGVRANRPVVAYDGGDGSAAARGWWVLRYFGHADVRVLDGGFAAWSAAGLPVESGDVEPSPGDFVARPGSMPVLDAETAAALAAAGTLLDARAPERYRGESEPIDPVAGHIPGAVNAPTAGIVGDDGRLLSLEELAERFSVLGVRAELPVGAYCGSGVTAAHTVLALDAIGIQAALYVGSWSNWVSDPGRPVATGSGG